MTQNNVWRRREEGEMYKGSLFKNKEVLTYQILIAIIDQYKEGGIQQNLKSIKVH